MWLAIDTTGSWCSVALGQLGQVHCVSAPMHQGHSRHLLGMVQSLLQQYSVGVKDLTGIAYGAGPGSFTGLRIACGVAQGMAFAASKPLIGVSATATLAQRWQGSGFPCLVAFDARMNQVYAAAYKPTGQVLIEPFVADSQDVALRFEQFFSDDHFVAVGNGFEAISDTPFEPLVQWGRRAKLLDAQAWPSAQWVLELAVKQWQLNPDISLARAVDAAPFYVRNQVALDLEQQRALRQATHG